MGDNGPGLHAGLVTIDVKRYRGARMYTVLLGGPMPHIVVDKGRVRVAAVDVF
jgi:hypothetical protein